jgi:hypothetical protein
VIHTSTLEAILGEPIQHQGFGEIPRDLGMSGTLFDKPVRFG